MKKSRFLIIISFVYIFCIMSCNRQDFRIDGTISIPVDCEYAMLFTFYNDSIIYEDTAVIVDGKFMFTGEENIVNSSLISVGNYPGKVLFAELVLEKGKIKVEMNDKVSRVEGTPLNDLYNTFTDSCNRLIDTISKLYKEKDYDAYIIMQREYTKYNSDFKKVNIKNAIGKKVFLEGVNDVSDECFDELFALADEEIKSNHKVLYFKEDREKEAERKKREEQWVGKKFSDFKLETAIGELKNVSDYFGNSDYIFIDFWASWCNPCVEDIPSLKQVYSEYKEKGFTIISISFDQSKNRWKEAMRKYDMPWIQFIAPEGFKSEIAKKYDINGITYGLLVDKKRNEFTVVAVSKYLNQIMPQLYNWDTTKQTLQYSR